MAGPEGPAYMRKDGYFMKAMKRRLLSLLLAMAMVCSLVPSALAAADITISGTASAKAGQTISLTATGVTGDGSSSATYTYGWERVSGDINVSSSGATASITCTGTPTASNNVTGVVKCTATPTPSGTAVTKEVSVTFTPADPPAPVATTLILGRPDPSTLTAGTGTSTVTATVQDASDNGMAGVDVSVNLKSGSTATGATARVSGKTGANGTVTITVTPGNVAGTATFQVSAGQGDGLNKEFSIEIQAAPTPATGIQMDTSNKTTVKVGETGVIWKAKLLPNGATGTVTWSSSVPAVADINASTGAITAKTVGETIITAAVSESVKITAKLTVEAAAKSAKLEVVSNKINVGATTTLTVKPTGLTAGTDYDYINWVDTQSGDFVRLSSGTTSGTGINTNTAYGYAKGSVSVYARLMKDGTEVVKTNSVTIEVVNTNPVTISTTSGGTAISKYDLAGYGSYVRLYANIANANSNNYTYLWSIYPAGSNVISMDYNQYYYVNIQAENVGKTTLTVTVKQNNVEVGSASVDITVGQNGLQPSVTVSGDTDYLFSERDSLNKSSVVSQIESMVSNSTGRSLYSVVFSNVDSTCGNLSATRNGTYYADGIPSSTGGRLSDIVFSPRQNGKATFNFYAYYSINGVSQNNTPLSGVLTIEVKDSVSTGDIPYTASIGDDVPFDIGDFEDFYYSKTSRGTLEYVTFSMPSGGYLYSDRSRLSSSNATCYVSPRSTQNDLGSVYFSPSGTTASKAGTVRVNFTAYGNRNGNSGVSGTVAITYLNGAAKDISYSTVGGSVTLDPQDFIDAYKEVTGKTAPSNLTIQFQEVPANGTLTYTGGSRDVDLTKSNVRSNKYSTKTTGTYRLNQLTYTGTKGKDTVAYIAYNGSTAQFTGNVVFNGTAAVPTDVVVTYGSTGGQAVVFSQNDFIRANSVMSNAVKVRFVTPANGTLTMNGSSAAGIDVATSLLGSVTYKPKAGFNNNTDRITFVAYDSRNQLVASGSVNITVVGNTSTTTTPGGVTDVSQFKDVASNAWYRNDLDTLVKAGVITGKGEGKFDPKGTVTYGEALKMVLEACGYTATVGTGSQWAINYKNLAVSRGWISSSIDLNASISRNATAELAAKVMGVAPATSGSPFADEANAYAVALYYTNPQIFVGSTNPNGGKPLFENNKPLLREQVCAVICRVRTYNAQQTTDTMPDGI